MWKGARVVITGGSSGAGKELARQLLTRGAQVTLVARDPEKLQAACDELGSAAAKERIALVSCDVARAEQVNAAFAPLCTAGIDLLVCSAGVLTEGPFDQQPLEAYRRVIDVNVFGALHCARAALPALRQSRGAIVNIASVAGLLGVHGYGPYCTSKHALVGLTETMRIELLPQGVRVHLVCPPEFDSPMVTEVESYRSPQNRAMARSLGVLSVETVAREILAGLERGRFMIIPGRNARVATTLARLFPGMARATVDRNLRRTARRAQVSSPAKRP